VGTLAGALGLSGIQVAIINVDNTSYPTYMGAEGFTYGEVRRARYAATRMTFLRTQVLLTSIEPPTTGLSVGAFTLNQSSIVSSNPVRCTQA
jgi:hypothetical protein